MSKHWIDKMFAERDDREAQVRQKREQEILREKKIADVAPAIWAEIERMLRESVDAFNQKSRVPKIIRKPSQPYTLQLQAGDTKIGFVVSYNTATGILSYGNPFDPDSSGSGTLLVRIDPESHYTIHNPQQPEPAINIEDVDQLILGNFMKSLIKAH